MKLEFISFIARDKDGKLHWFDGEPKKLENCGEWTFYLGHTRYIIHNDKGYENVKWEDEKPTIVNFSPEVTLEKYDDFIKRMDEIKKEKNGM